MMNKKFAIVPFPATGDVVPPTVLDRRARQRVDPPCRLCNSAEHVRVTARTTYLLYFKCKTCGNVWDAPKPPARGLQNWHR